MRRITVPLNDGAAERLIAQAKANKRAAGQEAALIIEAALPDDPAPRRKGTQLRTGAAV